MWQQWKHSTVAGGSSYKSQSECMTLVEEFVYSYLCDVVSKRRPTVCCQMNENPRSKIFDSGDGNDEAEEDCRFDNKLYLNQRSHRHHQLGKDDVVSMSTFYKSPTEDYACPLLI